MVESFRTGNPIWIYYTDIDTGTNLQVPHLLRGLVGAPYKVEKSQIPRYKFLKATGSLTGTFDNRRKAIHLYYRKKSWHTIQQVRLFVETLALTPVYDEVKGLLVGSPFPAGLYLRAFQLVETVDHELWYQINAERWIRSTDKTIKVHKENPYKREKIKAKLNLAYDMTALPLNHEKAVVDYVPNGKIDIYDHAYGERIGSVANGDLLELVGQMKDSNGVTWYETVEHFFINGAYVKLNRPNENDD